MPRHDFPDDNGFFDRLVALLRAGDAIAVVGADLTADLYPPWPQAVGRLIEDAAQAGLASEQQVLEWRRRSVAVPDHVLADIHARLGEKAFRASLRRVFGPRPGPDGKWYSPALAAILRLPFKAVVTANVDAALLEARRDVCGRRATGGVATWMDAPLLKSWDRGDAFEKHRCPLLFLQGVYEREDTIRLGEVAGRRALHSELVRTVFRGVWTRGNLVFIGVRPTEPWIKILADTPDWARNQKLPRRHLALLPLRPGHQQMDEPFLRIYQVDPLYFGSEEPGSGPELLELLEALAQELKRPPPAVDRAPLADNAGSDSGAKSIVALAGAAEASPHGVHAPAIPLPEQTTGPRFRLDNDNCIVLAGSPGQAATPEVNTAALLCVQQAIARLAPLLGRNAALKGLAAALRRYRWALSDAHDGIDWGLVWGLGVRMAAETAKARDAGKVDAPTLPALKTLGAAHADLVRGTTDGQRLSAMAVPLAVPPDDRQRLRDAAIMLADNMLGAGNLVSEDAADILDAATGVIGLPPRPERGTAFAIATLHNFLVVLLGAATASARAAIGVSLLPKWTPRTGAERDQLLDLEPFEQLVAENEEFLHEIATYGPGLGWMLPHLAALRRRWRASVP